MATFCEARSAGVQEQLPNKPKKAAARQVTLAVGLVMREERVLVVPRPEEGIWGGLWGFPTAEPPKGHSPAEALARELEALGLGVESGEVLQTLKHTLTHRQLTMPVVRATWRAGELGLEAGAWVTPDELSRLPLPVPMQKIARSLDPGPLFRLASDML